MEQPQSESQVVQTTTTSSSAQEAAAHTPAPAVEAKTPAAPGGESVTPVTEQYTPNFKYKAAGKELEFDEWVRPVVKSKEHEENLRKLYEKANGLDLVTESRAKATEQLTQVSNAYQQLYTEASEIMALKKEGDWGNFFKKVGANEQEVLNYFIEKYQVSQLPPEQQKLYNERNALKDQDRQWQQKFQSLENQYRQMEVRSLTQEFNMSLQNPEVQEIQKNYDTSMGQEGAFKELVKDMALAMFNQTGQDPTAEQAIRYTIQRMGSAYKSKPADMGMQSQPNMEKPLPVIPKVSGAGMSPTRKSPRSLDELRKMAQDRA